MGLLRLFPSMAKRRPGPVPTVTVNRMTARKLAQPRHLNRRIIVESLLEDPTLTITALARRAGVSMSRTGYVVQEEDFHAITVWVRPEDTVTIQRGQPPTTLSSAFRDQTKARDKHGRGTR